MSDTNIVVITGAINDAGTPQSYERATKRTVRLRSVREYREKRYETWVDVSLWGDLAQTPWLAAGVRVVVIGRLASESWVTQSGETKSKLVVVANSIEMLAQPQQPPQYAQPQPQTYGQYQQAFQAQKPPPQAHTYQGGQWVPPQPQQPQQQPQPQGDGAKPPDLPF